MNNSTSKTKTPRSGARKPAPAGAGSSATPPSDGPDGVTSLAPAMPEDAVNQGTAAAAPTGNAAKPVEKAAGKPETKARKARLVHGTFALPKDEYTALGNLKKACQDNGLPVKKSQLLRVAIALLRDLDQARLAPMIAALPPAKRAGTKKKRK